MTDVVGNPEEERRADFFHLPWSQEAVCRYFYGKVRNLHSLPMSLFTLNVSLSFEFVSRGFPIGEALLTNFTSSVFGYRLLIHPP